MFGALVGIVGDTVKILAAPVEVSAEIVRSITKPAADLASEAKDAIVGDLKTLRDDK